MAKITVSFTLSEDLAKQLDKRAKAFGMNRSAFMEWLMSNVLPLVPLADELITETFKAGLRVRMEQLKKK
jgi:Ribbon-helix-helix protein, copG family.